MSDNFVDVPVLPTDVGHKPIDCKTKTTDVGEVWRQRVSVGDTVDFLTEVVKGNVPGHSIVHKFGAGTVTTTLAPISQLNKYETPTTAQALEIVSDNAADAQNGVGAREITVVGLNASWAEVTQVISTHATDGTIAVAVPTSLVRVYRWFVSSSGAYATATTGSHSGNLTIRGAGGGTTWDTIAATPFPTGQSQIGSYTIPTGYKGYILGKTVFTDTSKTADVYMFRRDNADDVTTPYSGIMRLIEREVGVAGGTDHHFIAPKNALVGPCDMGFMAKVISGSADMSVEFELLLVQDGY